MQQQVNGQPDPDPPDSETKPEGLVSRLEVHEKTLCPSLPMASSEGGAGSGGTPDRVGTKKNS